MAVPSDPPVAVTPAPFRSWALNVSDTAQDHDTRIAAVETKVANGDKGDITVSGAGTTWTIDSSAVTIAKIDAAGTPSASTYLRGDGSWSTPAGGSSGLPNKFANSNSATTSIDTASAWANLSTYITIPDLTLTGCTTGDVVAVSVGGYWGNNSGISSLLDAATIVGGTLTNYLTTGTSSPATGAGFRPWQGIASTLTTFYGELRYVLQSGDISSGSVTFRLRVFTDGAKTLYHDPLQFAVINYGAAQS